VQTNYTFLFLFHNIETWDY